MHGLIAHGGRIGRIAHERTQGAHAGQLDARGTDSLGIGVECREQTGRHGFHVPLGAGDLTGQAHTGTGHGKGAIEHVRGVDKGIAMHDTVAEELSVLQARHHMEDALLLAKGQVGLEAHQVIGGLLLVLGTQLYRRPGATSGTRVGEANGLHGAKANGVLAGARNFLGRLAGLEQIAALKVFEHHAVGRGKRLDKGLVLLLIERSVEIVAAPLLLVARLREQHVHIERGGIDDRRRRIEERKGVATDELHDLFAQRR